MTTVTGSPIGTTVTGSPIGTINLPREITYSSFAALVKRLLKEEKQINNAMVQMFFEDKTDDQSNKRQKINPPPNNMQEDLARRIEALEQQQNQPELLQALIDDIDKHVANQSFDPEGNLSQTSTFFGEEVQCFENQIVGDVEEVSLVSYLNTSPLHIIRHRHYTSLESFARDLLSFFDFILEVIT